MENVVHILLKSGHTTSMLLNVKDFRPVLFRRYGLGKMFLMEVLASAI